MINATLPVRSIEELVTLARSTPGGLSFGSAGPGTGQHLNGELLKMRLGIPMQHVPYKSIYTLSRAPWGSTRRRDVPVISAFGIAWNSMERYLAGAILDSG